MLRPSSCPLARSIVSLAALSAAALSLSVVSVQATPWNLTTSIAANEFFNTFDFFNETDPTNGLVNYASKDTAQSQNLSFVREYP